MRKGYEQTFLRDIQMANSTWKDSVHYYREMKSQTTMSLSVAAHIRKQYWEAKVRGESTFKTMEILSQRTTTKKKKTTEISLLKDNQNQQQHNY